jgi:hypothetical protein
MVPCKHDHRLVTVSCVEGMDMTALTLELVVLQLDIGEALALVRPALWHRPHKVIAAQD